MKHKNQKKCNLEVLGSKNALRILRELFQYPHILKSVSEIAGNTRISRSNVYRAFAAIEGLGLVVQINHGKKKLYKLDPTSLLAADLYALFVKERYMNLPPKLVNILGTLTRQTSDCSALILFGSYAHGLNHEFSDVDLCCVTQSQDMKEALTKAIKNYAPEYRFELHFYRDEDFNELKDFVVLDSLLHGVPLLGSGFVLQKLAKIQNISKEYLVYRLQKCEEYIKRAAKVSGPARDYFNQLVNVSLGEIKAVLKQKVTIPKRDVKRQDTTKEIGRLHDELSKKGEAIWLI